MGAIRRTISLRMSMTTIHSVRLLCDYRRFDWDPCRVRPWSQIFLWISFCFHPNDPCTPPYPLYPSLSSTFLPIPYVLSFPCSFFRIFPCAFSCPSYPSLSFRPSLLPGFLLWTFPIPTLFLRTILVDKAMRFANAFICLANFTPLFRTAQSGFFWLCFRPSWN